MSLSPFSAINSETYIVESDQQRQIRIIRLKK